MRRVVKGVCPMPGLGKSFFFATVFFLAVFLLFSDFSALRRAMMETVWSIGIYEGTSLMDLRPRAGISNPVLSIESIPETRVKAVADPFLIRRKDEWFLFFEIANGIPGQGDVGFATSGDLSRWRYSGIVLNEPLPLVMTRG